MKDLTTLSFDNTEEEKDFVPSLSHIVCIDKAANIGVDNHMPWGHVKEELKYFQSVTKGHVVLMGKNTYLSIGHPLPNRYNIIVSSSNEEQDSKSTYVRQSLDGALALADYIAQREQCNIFIIGGGSIYEQTFHLIDKAYVTVIDNNYTHQVEQGSVFVKYPVEKLEDFTLISKERIKSEYFIPSITACVLQLKGEG